MARTACRAASGRAIQFAVRMARRCEVSI
jgi:hypothetical protein